MTIRNAALILTSLVVAATVCVGLLAAENGAAAEKGSIKGLVTYGGPVADVTVTLDGPSKKETKTNEKGEYTFSGVAAGDYKLEATGVVKNKRRKGTAIATMPDPPQEVKDVSIKLEL